MQREFIFSLFKWNRLICKCNLLPYLVTEAVLSSQKRSQPTRVRHSIWVHNEGAVFVQKSEESSFSWTSWHNLDIAACQWKRVVHFKSYNVDSPRFFTCSSNTRRSRGVLRPTSFVCGAHGIFISFPEIITTRWKEKQRKVIMNRDFDMQLTLDRERKWTCEKKKNFNFNFKLRPKSSHALLDRTRKASCRPWKGTL